MSTNKDLLEKLVVARNEIKNLRQQMANLRHAHAKEFEKINRLLQDVPCNQCRSRKDLGVEVCQGRSNVPIPTDNTEDINLKSVGIIRTGFPGKRGVPRQSIVGERVRSVVELNTNVFTNPHHAIMGLEHYSHLWLIYYFHKNPDMHPKAKVTPPRLNGKRVGVFATRSPHRPCPLGLSLVEIDKIQNNSIIFYGTDMVDQTPVLDIKPFIPIYDIPRGMSLGDHPKDPDGKGNGSTSSATPPIKIPEWVNVENGLSVFFDDCIENQLKGLSIDKKAVIDILQADPRSIYLRTKYGPHTNFTFQLDDINVTCKFNDQTKSVTVVELRHSTVSSYNKPG